MKVLLVIMVLGLAFGVSFPASATTVEVVIGASVVVRATATQEVQEFSIIAKNYEYLPHTIILKKGIPTSIYLTSIDRAHHIKIEGMKIREEVVKGKVTVLDFIPTEVGTYEYACDIYCGPGHRGMKGEIVVVNGNKSKKE